MRYEIFLLTCLLAAVAPFLGSRPGSEFNLFSFPGWPKTFRNQTLVELPLTQQERSFYKRFPGKTGQFSAGNMRVILRYVTARTRRLHPAAHCFKGLGYKTTPRPLWVDEEGKRWGCTKVSKDRETLYVYERLWDGNGNSHSDVSSWYWAALLGRSSGPWWAATVVCEEPLSIESN